MAPSSKCMEHNAFSRQRAQTHRHLRKSEGQPHQWHVHKIRIMVRKSYFPTGTISSKIIHQKFFQNVPNRLIFVFKILAKPDTKRRTKIVTAMNVYQRFWHRRSNVRITKRHFLLPKCPTHDFFVQQWHRLDYTLYESWGIWFSVWRFLDSINLISVCLQLETSNDRKRHGAWHKEINTKAHSSLVATWHTRRLLRCFPVSSFKPRCNMTQTPTVALLSWKVKHIPATYIVASNLNPPTFRWKRNLASCWKYEFLEIDVQIISKT